MSSTGFELAIAAFKELETRTLDLRVIVRD
jgi:hypothetical protein